MQDYKVNPGHWPQNPLVILLFIVVFEIGCYFLMHPLLEAFSSI